METLTGYVGNIRNMNLQLWRWARAQAVMEGISIGEYLGRLITTEKAQQEGHQNESQAQEQEPAQAVK